ncbi:MAG: T9SS type A sorting domain-containing protein [Bacteroidales bacterium]|nr:T9SS type A sorting domain-containing protein [Bacteroidales bacterium]
MKRLLFVLLILVLCRTNAQTTIHTIKHNGINREYMIFVPQTYNNTPTPLLFVLHGMNQDIRSWNSMFEFQRMSDTANVIIVLPQGLEDSATFPLVGMYNFGPVWNAGISIDTSIYTFPIKFTLGGNNDDVGFLLNLVDTVKKKFNIDNERVCFAGFSLGAFMCQRLAMEQTTSVIKYIASVSGTLAKKYANQNPNVPVSVMHIHGTADEIVNYNTGNLTFTYNTFNLNVSVGLSAPSLVSFWRVKNNISRAPSQYNYPNTCDDGITFERLDYINGTNNSKNAFIIANQGQHAWYNKPDNDIDYFEEIFAFFNTGRSTTGIAAATQNDILVFPNPAKNNLYVSGNNICTVEVFNCLGQCQSKTSAMSQDYISIDVQALPAGLYLLKITDNNGRIFTKKISLTKE